MCLDMKIVLEAFNLSFMNLEAFASSIGLIFALGGITSFAIEAWGIWSAGYVIVGLTPFGWAVASGIALGTIIGIFFNYKSSQKKKDEFN